MPLLQCVEPGLEFLGLVTLGLAVAIEFLGLVTLELVTLGLAAELAAGLVAA